MGVEYILNTLFALSNFNIVHVQIVGQWYSRLAGLDVIGLDD